MEKGIDDKQAKEIVDKAMLECEKDINYKFDSKEELIFKMGYSLGRVGGCDKVIDRLENKFKDRVKN